MSAIVFDTETTGTDDPEIVEAAWIKIDSIAYVALHERDIGIEVRGEAMDVFEQRYRPGKRIEFGAMATHNIIPEDLVDCPPHTDFKLPEVDYIVGHNIDFDMEAADACGKQSSARRICTLAIARKLWPESDSHRLGAMIYFHAGEQKASARNALKDAHSALADCCLCLHLLNKIIDKAGPFAHWEALWRFSEECRIPDVMTFGKHKGTRIKDVPADYKRWLLSQPDVDQYLAKALRA